MFWLLLWEMSLPIGNMEVTEFWQAVLHLYEFRYSEVYEWKAKAVPLQFARMY